ncbi:hypothetical protein NU688_22175 [Variovorax sp. ZS18.2.2]|uniref:hypothetical protein n=1 Tax=Variovorax sp. ZS18.2.2 TaxID=2971255 RepID=UPI002151A3C4|nr:hypothetical protein [Variovorax sp. ZS18.2.2]MCR6478881.1 hypothetical protein [Variovorax sp. ZS18.2.2]
MIDSQTYRRIVRASAWYDLVVTVGFATPWTFAAVHAILLWTIQALQLPGAFPAFDPVHMLMANLLGSVVTVWAILRIRDPRMLYGRYDAVARILFATWQIYAVMHGASVIILGFTAMELLFGVLECLRVQTSKSGAGAGRLASLSASPQS